MLTVVTFLWKRNHRGYQLPAVCNYTANHVNIFERMLSRHLSIPYELVCITDMPDGVNCRTIKLWNKCKELGGCYNRLYVFSQNMRELLGPRFACVDLDCVITGNVNHIFSRQEPFIINRYIENAKNRQKYNGSFFMMDAGVHDDVWSTFDFQHSATLMAEMAIRGEVVGSDQAWISHKIKNAVTVGIEDGIYNARQIGNHLPRNAAIVFFPGPRDPTQNEHHWIGPHYQ